MDLDYDAADVGHMHTMMHLMYLSGLRHVHGPLRMLGDIRHACSM